MNYLGQSIQAENEGASSLNQSGTKKYPILSHFIWGYLFNCLKSTRKNDRVGSLTFPSGEFLGDQKPSGSLYAFPRNLSAE